MPLNPAALGGRNLSRASQPARPPAGIGARVPLGVSHLQVGGFLLLTTLLSVVIPWATVTGESDSAGFPLVAALGLAAYAGVNLARIVVVGRAVVCEAGFWLFIYVWGALAPVSQLASGLFPAPGGYSSGDRTSALAMAWVGVLAYQLGAHLKERRQPRGQPRFTSWFAGRRLSPPRLVALGVIGLVVAAAVLPSAGGLNAFLESRAAVGEAFSSSTNQDLAQLGLRTAALTVPIFIALYGLLLVKRRLNWRSPWLVALGVALVAANALINGIIASPRYWFGTVAFSLLVAAFPLLTKRRVRLVLLGTLAALVLVFPLADFARRPGGTLEKPILGTDAFLSVDYDAYQQTLNGISYVRANGHSYGTEIASAALFWLPREIWHGKGTAGGERISDYAGYEYTNRSSPMWLEGFMDFGWIGVVLLLGAFGYFSRSLDLAYINGGTLLATFAPLIAIYQLFMLRGSLLPTVSRIGVVCLLLVMCSVARPDGLRARGKGTKREEERGRRGSAPHSIAGA